MLYKLIRHIILGVTLLPFGAFATSGWDLSTPHGALSYPNSQYYQRWPHEFHDDITLDQNQKTLQLTESQHHQALAWGLSDLEEKRYLFLMQNKSGVYYADKHLSPVEILALNAREDNERLQLATLAATQEAQKIAQELAYNSAFHQAYTQLMKRHQLPVILHFDKTPYSLYHDNTLILMPSDQVALFVRVNDAVKPIMTALMSLIKRTPQTQLNIYFVEQRITPEKIFAWAKAQNIPTAWVTNKMITLNPGNDYYQQLSNKPPLPALFRIHDGVSTLIDTGRF